jgi:hypothetical protein
MSHASRCAGIVGAATLVVVALVNGVAARGGGGRGSGGFSRGGPAAWGSLGRNRPAGRMDRGYNARGPAADGNFGARQESQRERQEQRQERREERQDRRTEHQEDWPEYAADHDERYYESDHGAAGAVAVGAAAAVYYTLPCAPVVMAMGGGVYYVCGADWYTRAYSDGEVVYTLVPRPQ